MPKREWKDEEYVTIEDCRVIRETPKAILIKVPSSIDEHWIPKSQIHDDSEVYGNSEDGRGPGDLIIPCWLAEAKDLA